MHQDQASAWVRRFVRLIRPGGRVLDLAAGGGRHTRLLLDMGLAVTAVDREIDPLLPLASARCQLCAVDLESGPPEAAMAPIGTGFDGIVVTNYLHRPLFPAIAAALTSGGV
jgi:2-polyprenyl-3-methyl-5-hydroxy-6-metoxy-1,4-benzoquinol methylase